MPVRALTAPWSRQGSSSRWNIFTNTRVSDFVRIAAEIEFEDGGDEITIELAAIDVGITPALTLRAGVLLAPLGRFNLSHDSPRNEFTDRPLVATELLGVALSQTGLGVLGLVGLGREARLTYELYAVNGYHVMIDDARMVPAPERSPQFEDNCVAAFVGASPGAPGPVPSSESRRTTGLQRVSRQMSARDERRRHAGGA